MYVCVGNHQCCNDKHDVKGCKSHGKIRITKCQKTKIWHLRFKRGNCLSHFQHQLFSLTDGERPLKYFSEKNRGFLKKPVLMPNQANVLHSNPARQIQATLGVNALQDKGRRYKVKSAARQTSNKTSSGLVFCRCDAAFVSPREGSAVSWLVSSKG